MNIIEQLYSVLYHGKPITAAINNLLDRREVFV